MSNEVVEPVGNGAIAVTNAWTTLTEHVLGGKHGAMFLAVVSAAGSAGALAGFRIQFKATATGTYVTRWSNDDFAAGTIADIRSVVGDVPIKTLAADKTVHLEVWFGPVHAIRVQAVAATTATITATGTVAPQGGGQ